ncbi:hypothetical protein A6U97_25855 [Agrobacterium tumefaciens]|nr:hypothetical protein A6U97_25855 [Agrobacterium tumefaciens]
MIEQNEIQEPGIAFDELSGELFRVLKCWRAVFHAAAHISTDRGFPLRINSRLCPKARHQESMTPTCPRFMGAGIEHRAKFKGSPTDQVFES